MKLPSVTTILSPFNDFSGIRPEVLQRAAERGTRVHAACAVHAQGLWADFNLQPGDTGYFTSFLKWTDMAQVMEFQAVELELRDERLGYMGHTDTIIQLKYEDRPVVIDYKTPLSVQKSWHPQIAAYAHLARANGIDVWRGMALRLRKDGKPAIATSVDIDGEPWAAFMNALGAYRYFKIGR